MSFDKLKELDLSRDEVNRIGHALQQPEFRRLFQDYVEEIQNPDNRKLYQDEITQLEKERGNDVTFINPEPGYVIKTSVDSDKKCFVNISTSPHVQRPTSKPSHKDGNRGLQWSLPHSLTPAREDIDNKGVRCKVFDVVFHPDTLHLASSNKAFREMVDNTSLDAIEANYGVNLDRNNLKYPKLKYKGFPHASMMRHPSKDGPVERSPEEKEFYDKIFEKADESSKHKNNNPSPPPKTSNNSSSSKNSSKYTTPKYSIKYRTHVDIQEFVDHKEAKLNSTIPKELVIEVNLPLLKSSSDITLDVTEKTVQLTSDKPSKYKLSLTLPYRVCQDNGSAKFDKDLKKLIITLPVKLSQCHKQVKYCDISDSGVESDQPPTPDNEELVYKSDSEDYSNRTSTSFLDNNLKYDLPEFTCHLYDDSLVFTLNVKNVDSKSIAHVVENSQSLHLKFTSISSSYYAAHHAFYVKFPNVAKIDTSSLSIEPWDNNMIVQIPLEGNVKQLKSYSYGLSEDDLNLKSKMIEEPAISPTSVLENPIPENAELKIIAETASINIPFSGTSYESSGDELSYSYSPSKSSRGILKRLSKRGLQCRSISESSLDDYISIGSSFDIDSHLPIREEDSGEMSASMKKTVRFNDVIIRQLYRSNSSILGQKKKNQRKSRNKKRAQERRHSESEASEGDEKRDGDGDDDDGDDEIDSNHNEIFDMESVN